MGSDAGPPSRFTGSTPAKGPLQLNKPRPGAEAFKKPELDGMLIYSLFGKAQADFSLLIYDPIHSLANNAIFR